MKYTKEEVASARESILRFVKPGTTVYTTLNHVSRSGMSRRISLYALYIDDNGQPARQWLDGWASVLLGAKRSDDGIQASGCGMDMGFHLVYNLSATLWPHGHGCTGKDCRSNDHSNGDRDYTPHAAGEPVYVNGGNVFDINGELIHWHNDGGYALRQAWL